MKHQGIWLLYLLVVPPVTLVTMPVSADEPGKPAAVAASTAAAPTAGTAPASAKPASVLASSGYKPPAIATHIEVVDAAVKLVTRYHPNDTSQKHGYKAASNIDDVHLIFKSRGKKGEFRGLPQKGPDKTFNYDGHTAFQILVEQGYFKYMDDIGFVPTEKYAKIRDIGDAGSSNTGGNTNQDKKTKFLDAGDDLNWTPTDTEKMVAPQKHESVVDDPSQKGGLFGYTMDDNLESYNPDDPSTPEGKRKVLKDRLSELSGLCWDTAEARGYLSCNEECNQLLFSDSGRVSNDKVSQCRNDCKAVFEQTKPQVCHDSDAVEVQLKQLGDEL